MKNTSYFSLQEDAPADKRSLFIWAARARARTRTHHISFLSISLYFSPTNKKHSPHLSTSKLGSSGRERGPAERLQQLTIRGTELPPLHCSGSPTARCSPLDPVTSFHSGQQPTRMRAQKAVARRFSPRTVRKGRILRAVSGATGLKV